MNNPKLKSITHYIFSYGLCAYLISISPYSFLVGELLALVLAFTVNLVIDGVGHTARDNIPVRTEITHSVYTAPAWGALLGAGFVVLPSWLLGLAPSLGLTLFFTGIGSVVGLGHLLLDALTQAGIFFAGRRRAIAHFSYDNPILNYTFIGFGIILLAAGLL